MRWFWIDRFTEFRSGSHAAAVKNVALDQEAVDDYCPHYTYLPNTLIIEGLAQLGGILVAEHFGFAKRVVLAKVGRAVFFDPARGGDQLEYRVRLVSAQEDGAVVEGQSHCAGTPQAEIQLMFAFLDETRFAHGPMFGPGDLLGMLEAMQFYDVATDSDGNPLAVHANL
jgi:3-hydroxyacyl-[acyl-carrier-protein] dehydratase